MGSKSGHPALQAKKTNPHKGIEGSCKIHQPNQAKPNQTETESNKPWPKDNLYRILPSTQSKPNNGSTEVQHTRNPIQQEQGSESNKNLHLDPTRPTARSNKTNSWVGGTPAKFNTRNSRINSQILERGLQPNADWWVAKKGSSQKTTTHQSTDKNKLDEVSVTVDLITF